MIGRHLGPFAKLQVDKGLFPMKLLIRAFFPSFSPKSSIRAFFPTFMKKLSKNTIFGEILRPRPGETRGPFSKLQVDKGLFPIKSLEGLFSHLFLLIFRGSRYKGFFSTFMKKIVQKHDFRRNFKPILGVF